MGLDMYLTRKSYVKNWSEDGTGYQVTVTKDGQACGIDGSRVSYVIEDYGYWRKANAIHKWFVENVQDGNDDCGTYHVSKEQFQQLIADCQAVLADVEKARNILPTTSGFFFGSMEYDNYYLSDLRYTVKICEEALSVIEATPFSHFYYHSSW